MNAEISKADLLMLQAERDFLENEVWRLRDALVRISQLEVRPPEWRQAFVRTKEIAREALK